MSTLIDSAVAAKYEAGKIVVQFQSGHRKSFPIKGNPRLEKGTAKELNQIELSPFGLHWPVLDEDLSFEGILRGDYGHKKARPTNR